MPTKHNTRSGIADEVRGVEYKKSGESGPNRGREFTKQELSLVYDHLCDGFTIERVSMASGTTVVKPAVRDAIRQLMNEQGYDGFGKEKRDGNPLRARELLTILTAVRDASENLRWMKTDGTR